jgi:hypothetical protein
MDEAVGYPDRDKLFLNGSKAAQFRGIQVVAGNRELVDLTLSGKFALLKAP